MAGLLGILLMALLVVTVPSTARAQTTLATLDMSGVSVVPGVGPTVRTLVAPAGTVDEIFFSFSVQHFGSSWGSETRIEIQSPSGDIASYRSAFGFGTGSGAFSFTGALPFPATSAAGTWTIRFYDTFNDSANPDHVYLANSTLSLRNSTALPDLELALSSAAVNLVRGQPMAPVTAAASGGDGDYGFSISPALPAGLSLDAPTGTISGTPSTVQAAADYTMTVTDGTGATETAVISIAVTNDATGTIAEFETATDAFVTRRMDRILSTAPRSNRLERRREAGGMPEVVLRADNDGVDLTFRGGQRSADDAWYFWAEGDYTRYTDSAGALPDRKGEFGLLSFGADYLLNSNLAVGVMAQVDRSGESISDISDVSGAGWMIGPYLAAEIRPSLFVTAQLGWGRSSNTAEIDLYDDGSPWLSGDFSTRRALARASLYGVYALGNGAKIMPEIDVAYMREKLADYTVNDGGATTTIAGDTFELGRIGLSATYETPLDGGDNALVFYATPNLTWNFEGSGASSLESSRGALELGLRTGTDTPWRALAAVRVDGLGSSELEAYSLRLGFSTEF